MMGAAKNYMNDLVCHCAPENGFAQDAIEFALTSGWLEPTGDFDLDVFNIFASYDKIIESWRVVLKNNPDIQEADPVDAGTDAWMLRKERAA